MYRAQVGNDITMSVLEKCASGNGRSMAVYRMRDEQLTRLEATYQKYKQLNVWSAASAQVIQ
jgi:hypothetical protein